MDVSINQNRFQLLQGQRLETQINNTLIDQQTSAIHSQSDLYDDSRIQFPLQKEQKNDSNDKESINFTFLDQKFSFQSKEVRRIKKHTSSLKKYIAEKRRDTILFICFGQKKIELTKDQINIFLVQKYGENYSPTNIKCKIIIEQIIRKLCINEYNFQPTLIKVDTFNILSAENIGQGKKQTILNECNLDELNQYDTLIINRIPRSLQLTKYYQQLQQKSKELQILQIISADQRDLIEVIQKNKTYGDLKQKLLTYYYQMVGKIILVSYHTFKVIDNRKKITDINDRIIQIYQEKTYAYQDNIFRKQNQCSLNFNQIINIINIDTAPFNYQETKINSTMLYGDLYLQIKDNKLIQKYMRGAFGYFSGDRIKERSLLTLVSIKIINTKLYLQFKYKNGSEVVIYSFDSSRILIDVINAILLVVRFYNNKIQVMK